MSHRVIVLALDTTLGACSVVLSQKARVLVAMSEPMERGHAERLAPMAAEAMQSAQIPFSAIDRIAVTIGPGSFTGVRVGLAFARGLGLALNKPVIGFSTLEVLAREDGDDGARAAVVTLTNTIFCAAYENGEALLAPTAMAPGDAAAALLHALGNKRASLRGPGAKALAAACPAIESHIEISAPDVTALARLAARAPIPDQLPAPLYLRQPNITPPA
jgi:tRNA threonylcarbamoyladenosine biosynthesis protein TsaB